MPSGHYSSIIERLRPDAGEPGDIVHVDGRVLGRHAGIIRFTVGQRRGLGIAAGEPLFVVRLEAAARRVIVGPRAALHTRAILLRNVNWIGEGTSAMPPQPGDDPLEIQVRVRSTQAPRPALLSAGRGPAENGLARVELLDGEYGVSPGQACVFYADGTPRAQVLGGGWICQTAGQSAPAERARRTERETEPAIVDHRAYGRLNLLPRA